MGRNHQRSHFQPLFPRGPGLGLRALVLLLACGGLMAAEADGDRFGPARQWMSSALSPLRWVAEIPSRIAALGDQLDSRESLLKENTGLKRRQLELEAQLQRYAALDAENRRLRQLLDASTRLSDRVAVADILAANQDPYRQQVTLNKGEHQGVYRGQALVDASGVLGQVIEVYGETSVGLLLTDPDHGVPVEVVRNGLRGVALGQGAGQSLKLPFLPANADVEKGDVLVSSSLGGRFPTGYPVGVVESILHTPGGQFKDVIVRPMAKVDSGRQALLVWSERLPVDPVQASEAAEAEARQSAAPPPDSKAAATQEAKPAVAPETKTVPARETKPAPAAAAKPAQTPMTRPDVRPNTRPPSAVPTSKPAPSQAPVPATAPRPSSAPRPSTAKPADPAEPRP